MLWMQVLHQTHGFHTLSPALWLLRHFPDFPGFEVGRSLMLIKFMLLIFSCIAVPLVSCLRNHCLNPTH